MSLDESELVRLTLRHLNPYLTCSLCAGYLIDATSVSECLHSFCRSCITEYLKEKICCPVCDELIHKTKPLLCLRPDKSLQALVYKLVPGLYKEEISRRRNFQDSYCDTLNPDGRMVVPKDISTDVSPALIATILHSSQNANAGVTHKDVTCRVVTSDECDKVKPDKDTDVTELTLDSYISVELQLSHCLPQSSLRGRYLLTPGQPVDDTRHLLCPARLAIRQLKRFLRIKFNLPPSLKVEIYHSNVTLEDRYRLIDIAHIYTWRRVRLLNSFNPNNALERRTHSTAPLKLYYVVYDKISRSFAFSTCASSCTDQPIIDKQTHRSSDALNKTARLKKKLGSNFTAIKHAGSKSLVRDNVTADNASILDNTKRDMLDDRVITSCDGKCGRTEEKAAVTCMSSSAVSRVKSVALTNKIKADKRLKKQAVSKFLVCSNSKKHSELNVSSDSYSGVTDKSSDRDEAYVSETLLKSNKNSRDIDKSCDDRLTSLKPRGPGRKSSDTDDCLNDSLIELFTDDIHNDSMIETEISGEEMRDGDLMREGDLMRDLFDGRLVDDEELMREYMEIESTGISMQDILSCCITGYDKPKHTESTVTKETAILTDIYPSRQTKTDQLESTLSKETKTTAMEASLLKQAQSTLYSDRPRQRETMVHCDNMTRVVSETRCNESEMCQTEQRRGEKRSAGDSLPHKKLKKIKQEPSEKFCVPNKITTEVKSSVVSSVDLMSAGKECGVVVEGKALGMWGCREEKGLSVVKSEKKRDCVKLDKHGRKLEAYTDNNVGLIREKDKGGSRVKSYEDRLIDNDSKSCRAGDEFLYCDSEVSIKQERALDHHVISGLYEQERALDYNVIPELDGTHDTFSSASGSDSESPHKLVRMVDENCDTVLSRHTDKDRSCDTVLSRRSLSRDKMLNCKPEILSEIESNTRSTNSHDLEEDKVYREDLQTLSDNKSSLKVSLELSALNNDNMKQSFTLSANTNVKQKPCLKLSASTCDSTRQSLQVSLKLSRGLNQESAHKQEVTGGDVSDWGVVRGVGRPDSVRKTEVALLIDSRTVIRCRRNRRKTVNTSNDR